MSGKKFSKKVVIAAFVLLALLAFTMAVAGCLTPGGGGGKTYSADVIIVGAGGAGMSATIEARKVGASVIVLEKSAVVGGNTLPAMSGLSAVGSDVQTAADIGSNVYTIDDFVKRHVNKLNNPDLVRLLAQKSAETVRWLEDMGLVLTIASKDGDGRMMHAPSGPGGQAIIPLLSESLKKSGATVVFNTTATELIYQSGKVVGVEAVDSKGNKLQFRGNAVILATGGYGRDNALVAQYRPEYAGLATDEIAPTTGDGLRMAQKIGAAVQDLDQFHLISKVEIISHDMILPGWIAENAIFVNYAGKRFLKEGAAPGQSQVGLVDTVLTAPVDKRTFYYIFDDAILKNHSGVQAFYNRRLTVQGATPAELAAKLGIDPTAFENTINTWNGYFRTTPIVDREFGRTGAGMTAPLSNPPYYAIRANSGIHYCMGGLKINTQNQVITTEGNIIPGLYAAGEVTGGVHGSERVEGTAVTDSLVFGRLAGQQASAYAASQGKVVINLPAPASSGKTAVGNFTNGVHTGTGMGRNGPLTVSVTVANGSITKIDFVRQTETPVMFDAIERQLIPAIISAQSLNVDSVSGATISTTGVLEAVKSALE
ncbi:MAG: flavocytochrome c [Spirochaetaceae bacterium]|jgi:fumarate reductase flavoprotein subunit|nr:flavocytochrome c [Spirochaetaceae bacterium]